MLFCQMSVLPICRLIKLFLINASGSDQLKVSLLYILLLGKWMVGGAEHSESGYSDCQELADRQDNPCVG